MIRRVGATAALFVAPASILLAQSGHHVDPARFRPAAVEFAGSRVEIPLTLLPGNRATVSAMLNGAGPFVFAIETGAPFVILTEATAAAAHLTSGGSTEGHHWPSGMEAKLITVDSLRIGSAVVRGQPMVTGPGLLTGVDGILGLPVFASLSYTVDYPNQRLILDRSPLPAPDGRSVLPLLSVADLLGVTIELGGRERPAVIDTQGGTDIEISPSEIGDLRFAAPPVLVGQARIGTAEPVPSSAARLDGNVRFGRYTIERPIVHLTQAPPGYPQQVLLGTEILRQFAVTIDQPSMRVRFERALPVIAPARPVFGIGLSLAGMPGGPVKIAAVLERGAAAEAGIKVDDAVITIQGRPAASFLQSSELSDLVQNGTGIDITVLRDGARRTITVRPTVKVQ